MRCEFKECGSGLPGSIGVGENIGDGCWLTYICRKCAHIVGLKPGDDIPADAEAVNSKLRMAYHPPVSMKAISLWQPWASLMALGHKKNETRGKYTEYRGPLAIQAAKRIVIPNDPQFINALQDLGLLDQEFPQGAIVGICDLVEVERIGSHFPVNGYEYLFGNYTVGRYAWITENMRKVDPPIPCRGYQWLFDWEDPRKGQMG
ncbi:MAG: ASCH domain-containing protein [Syntrophobacteraceae bacterium]